jgi:cytochrome c556
MRRMEIARAIAGIVAAALIAASGSAFAEEKAVKSLMAENFAGMQNILVGLIMSRYETLPASIEMIREHAEQLPDLLPENAKDNKERFFAYAYDLKTHADYLKEMVELLIERDAERMKAGELSTDVLRDSAAAHYSGMVQACVTCHNRFRQHVVK